MGKPPAPQQSPEYLRFTLALYPHPRILKMMMAQIAAATFGGLTFADLEARFSVPEVVELWLSTQDA